MYDLDRLEASALASLSLPPKEARDKILAIQKEFTDPDRQPEDDIALLVVDL